MPSEEPKITVDRPRLPAGDTLRANCTSGASRPAPNITWTINGKPVSIGFNSLSHTFYKYVCMYVAAKNTWHYFTIIPELLRTALYPLHRLHFSCLFFAVFLLLLLILLILFFFFFSWVVSLRELFLLRIIIV